MFGWLFGRKKRPRGAVVIARLNARVMPFDRGDLYEDPLNAVLEKGGIGEVTGGGTQLGEAGEIARSDVEIEVHGPADQALALIQATLENLGAPKGSTLMLPDGREIPFGLNEGLAVYLNGTELPDNVYAECDPNFVLSEFNRLLGSDGKVHSHWRGPTETAIYMYGRSFAAMRERLAAFIGTYPLCQRARVVQIA